MVLTIVRLATEGDARHRSGARPHRDPTIETDTVGGNLAYIKLNTFNENAPNWCARRWKRRWPRIPTGSSSTCAATRARAAAPGGG